MFKVLPTKGFQHHNWFVSGPISIDVAVYSLQPRVGDLWAFLGCLRSTVQGHDRPPRMSGTFCARRDLGWRWDAELWWLQGQKKVHQVVFFRKVARNPCHPPQEVRTLRKLQGKINLQHSSTIEPVRSQVFTLLHFCSLIIKLFFNWYCSSFSSDPSVSHSAATYQCYGISNHSGTLHGGHYIAACRHPYNQDAWHMYNDRSVSGMTSDRVITPEAYLLFFQKVSPSS